MSDGRWIVSDDSPLADWLGQPGVAGRAGVNRAASAILVECMVLGGELGFARLLALESDAEDQGVASVAGSVLTVASVTFAHGSDNIAVYVPLFAIQTPIGIALIFVVFLLMTGVWLVLTHWFVRNPKGGPAIQRWGHRIVPWVLILLGVYILVSAGTITWLLSLLPLVQ
jgi:cadmium resistance protein CadD (predicted permease)